MTEHDTTGATLEEIGAYRGRGTRGWRIEADELNQETVDIEAGQPFGGEWPERQLWQIIDGEGRLCGDATAPSVHVRPGDGYRFAAGERRLIVAETKMRILIRPTE